MTEARFALQPHLDFLYEAGPRRLAYGARTLAEFADWQSTLRTELVRLLGLTNRPAAVAAEKLEAVDRGLYVEEKYSLDVGEQVQTPMYILTPKHAPPFKPILVFHGHDPGVQFVLGHFPDADSASENLANDNNYAQALAQAGYLVCALEQRGMGERLTEQVGGAPYPRSCRHLAFDYMLHGRSLLGERCWDGMCAINYLKTRSDVQAGMLGCTGHSGGGCTALWLAAIEPRITAAVVSGYFCSFKASILSMTHCECNYVPGILELGEMGDIAALIAPRPLCLLHGEHDPIFPVKAARAQFETVKQAYAIHDSAGACSLTIHRGGHAYHHASSQAWFAEWL